MDVGTASVLTIGSDLPATSGFYACLDGSDEFHPQALAAFERAEQERWELVTTNYMVLEARRKILIHRRQPENIAKFAADGASPFLAHPSPPAKQLR